MISHVPTPFDRLMDASPLVSARGSTLSALTRLKREQAVSQWRRVLCRRRRVCRPSCARLSRELMAQ